MEDSPANYIIGDAIWLRQANARGRGRPCAIAVSRPSHQTQYPLRLPWPAVGRPVGPGRRVGL